MRTVPEWVGRSDDAMPPRSVFDRLWAKQEGKSAISGLPFQPGDRVVRDHIVPLADGGENRETNLQLITEREHRLKTGREAMARAIDRSKREKHRGYVRKPSRWPKRRQWAPRVRDVNEDMPEEAT